MGQAVPSKSDLSYSLTGFLFEVQGNQITGGRGGHLRDNQFHDFIGLEFVWSNRSSSPSASLTLRYLRPFFYLLTHLLIILH